MTAPVGAAVEAGEIALAFQLALAKIGVKTIQAALALWKRVPPNKAAEVADAWLNDAVQVVMTHREQSRDLSLAYYRLARALRTGTTIPDPNNPEPKTVSLAELRREFQRLVEAADPGPVKPQEGTGRQSPTTDNPSSSETAQGASEGDVPIDDIEGISDTGDSEAARLDKEAEQEAKIVLRALGTSSLQKKVSKIDHSRPATEVDELRDEAHSEAGSQQAAAAARIAKNGARETVTSLAERDRKVIGYVRISMTGTPCGWCAMLISRGLVFYRSEQSATGKTDRAATVKSGDAEVGDKFHDNCNCVAIPVYSVEEYKTSPEFALNREYAKLWPRVTRGYSGKEALSVWRKYFRRQQKESKRAQAA